MTELALTLISAALLNNFVLHWPLGVDPLLAAVGARCMRWGWRRGA
jgi:Na+-translocating ferredoxin:NAD+ oxidoreductase RnfA subunit